MSCQLMLMMACYHRPSESFSLQPEDLVPPVVDAHSAHQHWAITLHPRERGDPKPSKTGVFDESIQLDLPEHKYLGLLCAKMKLLRAEGFPLWPHTYAELGVEFKRAVEQLKYPQGTEMYQLRHTGASADFASNKRTIEAVKRRGRWRSDISLRRYEKGGRITEVLRRLTPDQRTFAISSWQQLPERLLQH